MRIHVYPLSAHGHMVMAVPAPTSKRPPIVLRSATKETVLTELRAYLEEASLDALGSKKLF